MKSKIFWTGALLLAASCTKDQTAETETTRTEIRTLTVETAADTRTQLADNGYGVLWSPGDQLGFFLSSGGTFTELNQTLNYEGDAPASTGRFSGKAAFVVGAGEHTLYAYYPYTPQATPKADSVVFLLQARQRQKTSGDSQHLGLYDFAVAQVAVSDTEEFEPLVFQHAFAVVEIDLTASGVLAGKTLASVSLYSSDPSTTSLYGDPEGSVYMYGPLAFDLTSGQGHTGQWAGGQSRALYVSLSFDEPPVLGTEPVKAYLTVNAQNYSAASGKIYLVARTDDGYYATVELPGIDIAAGQIRVIERELTQAVAPAAEIDLSAAGSANCYVAHLSGQLYSFDATKAGNGVVPDELAAAVERFEGRTLPTALAGSQARLLWQSDPDLIDPGSVLYSNGRIRFRTSGRPTELGGNCVIALYPDQTSDQALWSWHIWVTNVSNEELLAAAQTYVLAPAYQSVYGAGSTQMMDRTLGALTDRQSIYTHALSAMLYQWGRKDPFPAQNVVYTDNGQRIAYLLHWDPVLSTGSYGTTQGTGNTLYVIEHPATFVYVSPASSYDWYYGNGAGATPSERNNALWGNPEGWIAGNNTVKTLFDPCPAGWKMPHGYAFTGFTADGQDVSIPSPDAHVSGSFIQGWQFIYNDSDATYYPSVGSRQDELAFYASTSSGFYWTSAIMQNAFGANGLWMRKTGIMPTVSDTRGKGNPVRCMKE